MSRNFDVNGQALVTSGGVARIARLRDEYHDFVASPPQFVEMIKDQKTCPVHVFTFIQRVTDLEPHYDYHLEWDAIAMLKVSTYDHWWKKQINDKTRNMVRKAGKAGVEIRQVEFNDELVKGIVGIHNESPVRQGRRFTHYNEPFDVVKKSHATFLDRSEFFGAYFKGELIGFIKLVHGQGVSNLMQIISMISHRDKAPTNALVAKAVERCAEKKVPILHYGSWSRRSMGEFKKKHDFERVLVPRYYVPLTAYGDLVLHCGLHRGLMDRLPEPVLDTLATWRGKLNAKRYGVHT